MINLQNIQTEVDASYLYSVLAQHEEDAQVAEVFRQMSAIERSHAVAFLKKNGLPESELPSPSLRARIIRLVGRVAGMDFVLGLLLDTEKQLANSVASARQRAQLPPSVSDTAHVAILQNILTHQRAESGSQVARFEKRHRSIGGNALRAAVLGGNDGLVSNFSLVMGVAGATQGQSEIILAGVAGLLAGALSMALGEWISVKSSQELHENQMQLEMDELEVNPEGEEQELVLIYITKGIPEEQAREMAREAMQDKSKAHEVLVREELGISTEDLSSSPMEAAMASFFAFAIGAVLPVFPYFFVGGVTGIVWSAAVSTAGLFLIGAAITLFTNRPVLYSGLRQMFFGLAAAAITFGLGMAIGHSLG